MKLGNPIQLRLSIEKQLLYEKEAAAKNLPLSTWLRKRLEEEDEVLEQINALRRSVEFSKEGEGGVSENDQGILSKTLAVNLEILILLRQISQPQKVQMAQQELKRLGFEVWTGTTKEEMQA